MRFPSLHKLHAQKYKTSLSHRFRQCSGKPGRWVIFHIPFCAVSARGATCGRQPAPGFPKFQFTPLREGRLAKPSSTTCQSVFQFTPLREGRRWTPLLSNCDRYFNSRPCERGDQVDDRYFCHCSHISIHAPARGATPGYTFAFISHADFNSRPCERGDAARTSSYGADLFQFTPLREGRPVKGRRRAARANFNSRPCERGDRVQR